MAPPAQQVLLESQEVMATGGGGSSYHHHDHHAAATTTTMVSEAERGAAASALAAARSPGKARLWNERRYTDSSSQDNVTGTGVVENDVSQGGTTACTGVPVSEHGVLPKRRLEDTNNGEDVRWKASQSAKRLREDGTNEHQPTLDASLVSFSEESYAPPPYPPPPPPPPQLTSLQGTDFNSSAGATAAASAMVASAVSSAVAAAVAKSSAREQELAEQCNDLEVARLQAI